MPVLQKLLLMSALLVVSVAQANLDLPLTKLKNMQQAMATLNYQGTLAIMENGRLDTMKYSHSAKDGVEQERLLSLNSPLREVIRDSGRISCSFKETNKHIVNHRPVSRSFIIDFPQNLDQLNDWYVLDEEPEESVAMRSSWVINIRPRDNFRYSRRVWVDQSTYLPLKVEVYTENGEILEQVVFTQLDVMDEIPFVHVDPEKSGDEVQHIHQIQSESFSSVEFELKNIPQGFEKVFYTRMSMHQGGKPVDHLLLSDGFSSVSVYLDESTDDMQAGLQTVGSVNSYTRILPARQVTVMGEVPSDTVKFIADGIYLQP